MGVYAINAALQMRNFNSLRKEGNKMKRTVWEKMTEEERQWVLDEGHTPEDANDNVEDTIGFLHFRYAMYGKTLAEAEEMAKRLRNEA